MADAAEETQGNVSLSPRLQSRGKQVESPANDGGHVGSIINMQKAMYDILIEDQKRSFERLETRNDKLQNKLEILGASMKSVDVETADEIANLTRLLSAESDKVEELRENVNEVEGLREKDRQAHLENIDLSNEKYENARIVLTSSIKILNTKINTLEDYKQNRGALLEKLRLREETIALNDKDIKQERDAIDRKFKIDREKLKNEMFGKLLALVGTFQLEVSDKITSPLHRLMRENIFFKSELLRVVDEILSRKKECARAQTMENVHLNSKKAFNDDTRENLITIKIQRFLLKTLRKLHASMKKRLSSVDKVEESTQDMYDNLADSAKAELSMSETRVRKLEVVLYRERLDLGRVKYLKNQTDFRSKKYEEILYDLKYVVACALKMTETGEDILEMSKTELVSHLLELIDRGQSKIHQYLAAASNESVSRPNDVYVNGDLGFEPKHIDLEEFTIVEELPEEEIIDKITLDISAISGSLVPTISMQVGSSQPSLPKNNTSRMVPQRNNSQQYPLDEPHPETSTEGSSALSRVETATPESKESSDFHEDIYETSDSIIQENEESLSAESEEQEEEPEF